MLETLDRPAALLVLAAAFFPPSINSQAQDVCGGRGHAAEVFQSQSARRSPKALPPVDPQLKSLISDSDAVLPEFKADVILSLVESGKIADAALKKKLINRAYAAAESVEPPFTEAPYGRVGNTPQSRKAVALSMTQLDRMSLQSRAVHDMQPISSVRAKGMFSAVSFPDLQPLGCDDNWIYDPGPFYAALAEVLQTDFSAAEISEGKRLTFLSPLVARLGSQAQVVPVAHLLATGSLTAAELRDLLPTFAASMQSVSQDGHTFAVIAEDDGSYAKSVYGDGLVDAISALVATAEKSGVSSGPVLRSVRSYLVQNFNGPRCNTDEHGEARKTTGLPTAVTSFNHTFDRALKRNGLAPISSEEIPRAAVLPTRYWDDASDESYDSKQLTIAIQKLHSSRDRHTARDGSVGEVWWHELDDFLSRFYAWQQGDEAEANYVREKANFYMSLVQIIPKSAQRGKVLENFVSFLEQHSYQNLGGAEWFVYVKLFFLGMYAKDSHDEIIRDFLNSRDPVLSLYARLELWNGAAIGPHWPAKP